MMRNTQKTSEEREQVQNQKMKNNQIKIKQKRSTNWRNLKGIIK